MNAFTDAVNERMLAERDAFFDLRGGGGGVSVSAPKRKAREQKSPDDEVVLRVGGYGACETYVSVDRACLHGYKIERELARGGKSTIYCVEPDDATAPCTRVLKVSQYSDLGAFGNEADIAKRMGVAGIGPRVFENWPCTEEEAQSSAFNESRRPLLVGFIVMEYAGQDPVGDVVNTAMKNMESEIIRPEEAEKAVTSAIHAALEALNKMHELGYAHNDAHMHNFMLQTDPPRAVIIDFGESVETNDPIVQQQDASVLRSLLNFFMRRIRAYRQSRS